MVYVLMGVFKALNTTFLTVIFCEYNTFKRENNEDEAQ